MRIGRFHISGQWMRELRGKDNDVVVEALSAVFRHMIPIRIEDEVHQDRVLYYCYSELFREVEEGEIIPYYLIIGEKRNGEIIIRAEERWDTTEKPEPKWLGGEGSVELEAMDTEPQGLTEEQIEEAQKMFDEQESTEN